MGDRVCASKNQIFRHFFIYERKIKNSSENGFDIDFELSDSENKAEEIVIEISEENFYFKERNCT